jgi:hypothetical protein
MLLIQAVSKLLANRGIAVRDKQIPSPIAAALKIILWRQEDTIRSEALTRRFSFTPDTGNIDLFLSHLETV